MSSDLDRWQAAVEKATDREVWEALCCSGDDELDVECLACGEHGHGGWGELHHYEGCIIHLIAATREALPPLLEIARLAAKMRLGKGTPEWVKYIKDTNRLDALLRKHTEVREDE